jgi:hypothetical protein
MPLDYLEVTCRLAQIKRSISRLIYQTPRLSPPKISMAAVSAELSRLNDWYNNLPPNLRDFRQVPSAHCRSVAILHLRYWRAVMFATRPFLLYTSYRGAHQEPDVHKQAWFADLGRTCVGAAEKSLQVLTWLRERHLLTSLIPLDCTCVLETMQVFMLVLAGADYDAHLRSVRACLSTLQGMERILWTKQALKEVVAQLEEHGIWDRGEVLFPAGLGTPGLMFLDVAPPREL